MLQTICEGCQQLLDFAEDGESAGFRRLAGDIGAALEAVFSAIGSYQEPEYDTLRKCVQSDYASLQNAVRLFLSDAPLAAHKIRYELLPLVQGAYTSFYLTGYVYKTPERLEEFFSDRELLQKLCVNPYIEEAERTGSYRYDVSVWIQAYNKLDYTKDCVNSFLANVPEGLNYELILCNHGSTDGTREYFEQLHPTKQIDIAVNGGGGELKNVIEGKYLLSISNDVLVLPNAIENILACAESDDSIAYVVPSTCNVSNLQTIPVNYDNEREMMEFARKNNVLDPYRWERRGRLCNPICLLRSAAIYSSSGIYKEARMMPPTNAFPDDRISLLFRRAGYKMMLAKDAYCHHFGSVTMKEEGWAKSQEEYYKNGKKMFFSLYGVDPWETGCCYAPAFAKRIVGSHEGHTEVLGINCGMGANSLKIKEQIKEYCHNTDCILTNITDSDRFILDLKGIGDSAEAVKKIKDFKNLLYQHYFDYIVWETPFLPQQKFSTLFDLCLDHLTEDGTLLLKVTEQTKAHLNKNKESFDEIGDGWVKLAKNGGRSG